jgi:hypothetical protein
MNCHGGQRQVTPPRQRHETVSKAFKYRIRHAEFRLAQ